MESEKLSTNLQEEFLVPENANDIVDHWRKDWSDRSRSDAVSNHGVGFFLWRSAGDGLRGSGMFYRADMIDRALPPPEFRERVRAELGQIDHETMMLIVLVFEEKGEAAMVVVPKLAQTRPQSWFEMRVLRKRSIEKSVWIPLRSSLKVESLGDWGYDGYIEEYFGLGSVMFDTSAQDKVLTLGWSDIGIGNDYSGGVDTRYSAAGASMETQQVATGRIPFTKRRFRLQLDTPTTVSTKESSYHWAGSFRNHRSDDLGTGLVIEQALNHSRGKVWHLHQDFVIALGLLREDDTWVRPDEGYVEVVRLKRDESGQPVLLEARAEHLRDYLKARNMNLHICSYRSRRQVVEEFTPFDWGSEHLVDGVDENRWEGIVLPIHEGGSPFGSETGVFHVSRTDVDQDEDVPVLGHPTDDATESKSWTIKHKGRKLYSVSGELWRTEVLLPGRVSERVMGEDSASSVDFVVDPSGERLKGSELIGETRWLWFRPSILATMNSYRGSTLKWYTRFTGQIGLTPESMVHFGVNESGLLNVFAKDVGMLPTWQQRVWAGVNEAPDGGVCAELLASQMRAKPASTRAPEDELRSTYDAVNEQMSRLTDLPLFKDHPAIEGIFDKVHRYRALGESGLPGLAKDLARLVVESMDGVALTKLIPAPKSVKAGSIKHLEHALAKFVEPERARQVTAPLVGINELRNADAHLPSQDLDKSMNLAGVTLKADPVGQALQMLDSLVESLSGVARIFALPERE